MDKSCASYFSVHREFKNLCFISIQGRVSKFQMFVYVVGTKELTDDRSSVNSPYFSITEVSLGKTLYLGGLTNS